MIAHHLLNNSLEFVGFLVGVAAILLSIVLVICIGGALFDHSESGDEAFGKGCLSRIGSAGVYLILGAALWSVGVTLLEWVRS